MEIFSNKYYTDFTFSHDSSSRPIRKRFQYFIFPVIQNTKMHARLPKVYKKLIVDNLTSDFRKATKLIEVPFPEKLTNRSNILVKNHYAGINASDINFTSGKYYPGKKPPFPVGFEGVGEVVVSDNPRFKVGQPVAYLADGSFSEFHEIPGNRCFKINDITPEYVGLLVSGLTAKLALDRLGDLTAEKKQTVLVTAAAGGTGHLFCQLAKRAHPDNCVIGTTSSSEKAEFLSQFVDHAVDLSKDSVASGDFGRLIDERSVTGGLDLVYESVGRDLFDSAFKKMNIKSRMIIIGYIGGYKDSGRTALNISKYGPTIPVQLLMKSASLRGFFLFHYANEWQQCFKELDELMTAGELKVHVDTGFGVDSKIDNFKFEGIEQIADAVDYLYTRKSVGKVVTKF